MSKPKVFKISDEQIKQMYLDGYSLYDIAKVAQDNKGLMALRARLHSLGVSTKRDMKRYSSKISASGKKYNLNEHVFDSIDSNEKAYWLGFLMADGYNREVTGTVALRLWSTDRIHLEKYKFFLEYDGPIYDFVKNNRFYSEVSVRSKIMSESLSSLGCVQGKTYTLKFPEYLPKHLLSHFIRGYFDADGCISITERTDRRIRGKSNRIQFNIVGKEDFILKIQDILVKETGVCQSKMRDRKNSFAKAISYCGSRVVKKILDWLYKDATVYLQRKYDKYLQLGSSAE